MDGQRPSKDTPAKFILSQAFVSECYAILGFPQFLDGHYIYFVTKKNLVGHLAGFEVFQVKHARLEMILNEESSCLYNSSTSLREQETKYLSIFNGVNVENFYFSYELDLTHRLTDIISCLYYYSSASSSSHQVPGSSKNQPGFNLTASVYKNSPRDSGYGAPYKNAKTLNPKNPKSQFYCSNISNIAQSSRSIPAIKAEGNFGAFENDTQLGSSPQIRTRFAWNTHILNPLNKMLTGQEFIMPIICGYFQSRSVKIDGGKVLQIGVLSRRSRFQAGPRFLKRGIDTHGNVANEVETELFVSRMEPFSSKLLSFSSYLFYRGSIPFFWGHSNIGYSPKPDIYINEQKDPLFYATDKHFERLYRTYGAPITVLNLVKKTSPKEKRLGAYYQKYCERVENIGKSYVDKKGDFQHGWFDFFGLYNRDEEELLLSMQERAVAELEKTGFSIFNFEEASSNDMRLGSYVKKTQKGIVRVNCIDCLDRTNNAMACMSSVVLANLLSSQGVDMGSFYSDKTMAVRNELLEAILNIFGRNGDKIAQQYAGSEAFHKAQIQKEAEGEWKAIRQNIAFIAVKRYFSNVMMDNEKQRSLWLFLGEFDPSKAEEGEELWNLNPVDREKEEALQDSEQSLKIQHLKLRTSRGKLGLYLLSERMKVAIPDNSLMNIVGELDYEEDTLNLEEDDKLGYGESSFPYSNIREDDNTLDDLNLAGAGIMGGQNVLEEIRSIIRKKKDDYLVQSSVFKDLENQVSYQLINL